MPRLPVPPAIAFAGYSTKLRSLLLDRSPFHAQRSDDGQRGEANGEIPRLRKRFVDAEYAPVHIVLPQAIPEITKSRLLDDGRAKVKINAQTVCENRLGHDYADRRAEALCEKDDCKTHSCV